MNNLLNIAKFVTVMKSKNSGVNEITCSMFDMYCLLFLCEHHHLIAEMFTVFIKTLDAAIPVLLFDERFPFMRSLKVGFVDVSRGHLHRKYIWLLVRMFLTRCLRYQLKVTKAVEY